MRKTQQYTLFAAPLIGVVLGVALAGCKPADTHGAPVDTAASTAAATAVAPAAASSAAPAPATPAWQLTRNGMRHGALKIDFDMPREAVLATVAQVGVPAGPPRESNNTECGAGPMAFVYSGALTLNFQNNRFVGWMVQQGRHDSVDNGVDQSANGYRTAEGYGIGTRRDQIAPQNLTEMRDSSLDNEFRLGSEPVAIGGFFTGPKPEDTITGLFAGVQCFFR